MVQKKSFFADQSNHEEVRAHATGLDTTLRWSAAIELSEIDEVWAAQLLWEMRNDSDQYVQEVAEKGLRNFSAETLDKLATLLNQSTEPLIQSSAGVSISSGGMAPYVDWKTRPLEPPTKENEWVIGAAVTDIVSVEGPVTGARVLRLYGESVFPDSPKKINRFRVRKATEQMISRSRISRADNSNSDELEDWTLVKFGSLKPSPRERGPRRISEIPAIEIAAALEVSLGLRARRLNKDRKFEEILKIYGIRPNEFHLVGSALEREWASLLDSI